MKFSVFTLAACLPFESGASRSYLSKVPNGAKVSPNYLGHSGPGSSYKSNIDAFGYAFVNAGRKWTLALCKADSDGDGFSNGVELGDPDCLGVGNIANAPTTGPFGDPGDARVTPPATPTTPPPTTPPPTTRPPTTPQPTQPPNVPTESPTSPPPTGTPTTSPPTTPPPVAVSPTPSSNDDGGDDDEYNDDGGVPSATPASNGGVNPGSQAASPDNFPSPVLIGVGAGSVAIVGLSVFVRRRKQIRTKYLNSGAPATAIDPSTRIDIFEEFGSQPVPQFGKPSQGWQNRISI